MSADSCMRPSKVRRDPTTQTTPTEVLPLLNSILLRIVSYYHFHTFPPAWSRLSRMSSPPTPTRGELSKYFHLPIAEAALHLGSCVTVVKKLCRSFGIPRWPHRKVRLLRSSSIWVSTNFDPRSRRSTGKLSSWNLNIKKRQPKFGEKI